MKKIALIFSMTLVSLSCAESTDKLDSVQREKMRKHFDKDGDGKLNAEERAAAKQALLKRLDRNGDGKVDASERDAARNARS